jgi:hypothetical protein
MTMVRVMVGASLALLVAARGHAQTPLQDAAQQTQINECLLPLIQGVSDLMGCGFGFTSLGEIRFEVKNRGTVGINSGLVTTGGVPSRAPRASEPATKIRMDLYLDDKLIQSVYHGSLAGGETREFIAKIPSNYSTPRCGETRGLRLVIDPQNQIGEASENNNVRARTADRPCPDMEVSSIQANYNDLKTEFVAEIRIVNRGNAPARFRYLALTSNSSAFGPLPSADFDKLMEIEAGQSKKFTIGNAFSYSKMYVRVFLDRFNEVAELGESNNFKEKTLPE